MELAGSPESRGATARSSTFNDTFEKRFFRAERFAGFEHLAERAPERSSASTTPSSAYEFNELGDTLATSESGLDHTEPVDLADITARVLLTPVAGRRPSRPPGQQRHPAAPTEGDPRLLERLISKLIENAPRLTSVSLFGGIEHGNVEPGARAQPVVEERREATRSGVVGTGTLACRRCDAPIDPGGRPLSLAEPLMCPFCAARGPVRDFLSLATPVRAAHVVVRVALPAL
jgi:hypothetical protein